MLAVVHALYLFQQVLSGQQQSRLGHVLAGEEHLGQGYYFLDGPLALVLHLALELPSQALRTIHILQPETLYVDLELAGTARPQGAVAANLEVRYGLFGQDGVGEGYVFALAFEVVAHHLVHAALLQIHPRGLGHYQLRIHSLLRFGQRIGQYHAS